MRQRVLGGVLTLWALLSWAFAAPYTVQPGDTLYSLARRFGTTPDALQRANNLTTSSLRVGQVIEVPERKHTVAAGETLYGVARLYGVSVGVLRDLNKLEADSLRVGQVLLVPWTGVGFDSRMTTPSSPAAGSSSQAASSTPSAMTARPAVSATPSASTARPSNPAPASNATPNSRVTTVSSASAPSSPSDPNALPARPDAPATMPAPERPAPTLPSGSSAARPISPPSVPVGAALPSSPISIDPTLSVTLPVPSDQPQLVHIVVSGDTLFNIARRYSVSVADLKTENSLTTDSIALGQRLRIPGRIDPALGAGPRGLRDIAERYLGVTYVYGGSSAQGLDCSGFVSIVFAEIGVRLPRTSREQFQTGSAVAQPDLELGDLVFFDTLGAGAVSHVGIYLGGGEFIHAASNPGKVIKSKLEEKYYAVRYLGARRVLAQD